jgi:hypothetical protein
VSGTLLVTFNAQCFRAWREASQRYVAKAIKKAVEQIDIANLISREGAVRIISLQIIPYLRYLS